MLGEFPGHLGRYPLFPGMYQTDDLRQVFPHETLQQVSSSAGFDCAQYLDVSRIRRQNDDSRPREFLSNRDHGIETVHLWHLQIHQCDIRTMYSKLFDGLATVRSLGDQCHVRFSGQKRGHSLAEEGMIVDGENANGTPISAHQILPSFCGIAKGRGRAPSRKQWSLECATPPPYPLRLRSTSRIGRRFVG